MAKTRALLMLGFVTLAAACGRMRMGAEEDQSYVIFANQSLDQVDVYAAVPGGEVRRLGTVMSNRTDTLRVPNSIASRGSGLAIRARIFGSNRVLQSGPTTIGRGEMILVTLPATQMTLSVLPPP